MKTRVKYVREVRADGTVIERFFPQYKKFIFWNNYSVEGYPPGYVWVCDSLDAAYEVIKDQPKVEKQERQKKMLEKMKNKVIKKTSHIFYTDKLEAK